jgi:hypothetical protein
MTINLEMMKQLLQEFAEKEALTNEEIKVVEEQRLELEGRIRKCQDRLRLVSEDKVKISEMMKRYVGAGALNGARSVSAPAPMQNRAPVTPVPSEAPQPRPGRRAADASANMQPQAAPAPAPLPVPEPAFRAPEPVAPPPPAASAALSPSHFFDEPPAPPPAPEPQPFASAQDLVGSLANAAPAEQPPAPPPVEAPPAAVSNEPGAADEPAPDDTVKSINDALRGLFR